MICLCFRLMVTRFDSKSLLPVSIDKDLSDSDTWDDLPVCQRMGVMVAFQTFEAVEG